MEKVFCKKCRFGPSKRLNQFLTRRCKTRPDVENSFWCQTSFPVKCFDRNGDNQCGLFKPTRVTLGFVIGIALGMAIGYIVLHYGFGLL